MKSTLLSVIASAVVLSASAQATHTLVYNATSNLTCGVGDTLKLYGVTSGLLYEASTVSGGTLSISQILPTTASAPPFYIGYFVISGNETDVLFTEHSNNGTKTTALDVFSTTGFQENLGPTLTQLQLSPNPVTDILKITSSTKKDLFLYSYEGKLIQVLTAEAGTAEKDLSLLPKGIYFLRTGNTTLKIVKE